MAKVVNLRMARKRKSRAVREADAEQNRVLHSIPMKQRKLKQDQIRLEQSRLDGHEIESQKDK